MEISRNVMNRRLLRRCWRSFWFGFSQPGAAARWLLTSRDAWRLW